MDGLGSRVSWDDQRIIDWVEENTYAAQPIMHVSLRSANRDDTGIAIIEFDDRGGAVIERVKKAELGGMR